MIEPKGSKPKIFFYSIFEATYGTQVCSGELLAEFVGLQICNFSQKNILKFEFCVLWAG